MVDFYLPNEFRNSINCLIENSVSQIKLFHNFSISPTMENVLMKNSLQTIEIMEQVKLSLAMNAQQFARIHLIFVSTACSR